MNYEEQVRDGVLCYRTFPSDWTPMSAEMLTAKLLEARSMNRAHTFDTEDPRCVDKGIACNDCLMRDSCLKA